MSNRVLVVDDDVAMCQLLARDLENRGLEVLWKTDPEGVLDALTTDSIDVVLTDLRMPGCNGIELCSRIVQARPDIPVVVVTAFGSMDTAVEALRAGAYDFVTKPFELVVIAMTLGRALKHRALTSKLERLEQERAAAAGIGRLLGASAPMERLRSQIDRIANSEATVLITGESGTGKELVAKTLHERSRRQDERFVAVNCAALPEALLESELFGHARGAFTDARDARSGLFREADGGTLLLDEIVEIPLALQAKLLRVLEEGQVRPVGSDKEIEVDVRVLAATNRDLETAVEQRQFREDLFFRINVIALDVPPLRARGSDVLLLAQGFIERFAEQAAKEVTGMTEAVARLLMTYDWPGNVRELRNAMERAVAWTQFDRLTEEDLPDRIKSHDPKSIVIAGGDPAEMLPLEEVERRYVLHVLDAVRGHRSQAARVLGLDRKTLYRKLRRYRDGADDAE